MGKYNFDEIVNRRGTFSVKWDLIRQEGVIPMWVADMDFRTAPCVVEAVRKRVEHGVFGYTQVPDEYYEALTRWFERRHGFMIDRKWVIYVPGIVPALSAIIKAMTVPGDKVLVSTPGYSHFFTSIRNNGCIALCNDLIYKDNTYFVDYEDFERKAADPLTKVFILCNPHNPAGRVWTREELRRMGVICLRHNVFMIADEIHCELTYEGHDYTPFATVSEEFLRHSTTCCSPSKAFNIAGLQIANIVCEDEAVRRKIDRAVNDNEVCDVNPLGVAALIAAYNEGEEWLDELRAYLWDNYVFTRDYLAAELPDCPVLKLEGTYLVWMDIAATGLRSEEIERRLIVENHVWIHPGTKYGKEGFMRINIACPRATLAEGLRRVAAGIRACRK
ncbi:MAG: pyridoxal phosphate-dependent aminotransferase [Bacteroidales bacterium]|nr:pyridoxal phosphate-dependent aminotransferase [Bacteroidales bacterium]